MTKLLSDMNLEELTERMHESVNELKRARQQLKDAEFAVLLHEANLLATSNQLKKEMYREEKKQAKRKKG